MGDVLQKYVEDYFSAMTVSPRLLAYYARLRALWAEWHRTNT